MTTYVIDGLCYSEDAKWTRQVPGILTYGLKCDGAKFYTAKRVLPNIWVCVCDTGLMWEAEALKRIADDFEAFSSSGDSGAFDDNWYCVGTTFKEVRTEADNTIIKDTKKDYPSLYWGK